MTTLDLTSSDEDSDRDAETDLIDAYKMYTRSLISRSEDDD